MKPQISSSELAICSDNYREKAWHLASVLLFIGRPACPAELAGKCSLFDASPELIEFLCSIPNSPIFMTGSNFVLPSMVAYSAAVDFFANLMPSVQIGVRGARMLSGNVVRTYFRKRKRLGNEVMPMVKKRAVSNFVNENERQRSSFSTSERIVNSRFQVVDLQTSHIGRIFDALPFGMPVKEHKLEDFSTIMDVTPLMVNSNIGLLGYQFENEDQRSGNKQNTSLVSCMLEGVIPEELPHCNDGTVSGILDLDRERTTSPCLENLAEIAAMLNDNELDWTNLMSRIDTGAPCTELQQQNRNSLVEAANVISASDDFRNDRGHETRIKELAEWLLMDDGSQERVEQFSLGSCERDTSPQDKLCHTNLETTNSMLVLKNKALDAKVEGEPLVYGDQQSDSQKSCKKILATVKNDTPGELTQKQQIPSKSLQRSKVDIVNKTQKDQNTIFVKQKSKQLLKNNALSQEKCDSVHKSSKDQQESKSLPQFESYVVEEEEGSGGYGTVYRARRKTDGVTFAIKCPHENAHKHHVKNELKMLERFGGKNYVIRYEGSFKNGSSDCFVLEHFKHDRPEVLKKEIDIFQLQWYGYCMFRALASLHKQGVLHRDVKPGNFLFSCKFNKGYLIDFNLAKDLHQKHENIDKSQTSYLTSTQHNQASQSKSVSPNKRRKILSGKSSGTFKAGGANGSNLESKNLKKKTLENLKAYDDLRRRNSITSQGADASGLTSAKDVTPSTERLREPLPCRGRKELINLAQAAMQNPNLGSASAPASKRKRVAASPGPIDRKLIYITPMPLNSSGIPISGAGLTKNKGEGKVHKEGPCAGTKGFRAPEVLLRSLHQGPKIDVWSAGVTLIYLITGRMPFTGDPEQNMKDIVKLRGNEELWEVAKLHDRETSFPPDLLDIRHISSMKIQEWCAANTKRPDFHKVIPASLFDLIEKCLTVNPRLRLTAEEALRHEFFAPCHEALHKQKLQRRDPNQDSKSKALSLVHETSTRKPIRPPHVQLSSPVKFRT